MLKFWHPHRQFAPYHDWQSWALSGWNFSWVSVPQWILHSPVDPHFPYDLPLAIRLARDTQSIDTPSRLYMRSRPVCPYEKTATASTIIDPSGSLISCVQTLRFLGPSCFLGLHWVWNSLLISPSNIHARWPFVNTAGLIGQRPMAHPSHVTCIDDNSSWTQDDLLIRRGAVIL